MSSRLIAAIRAAEKGGAYTKPQLQVGVRNLIENEIRSELLWLRDPVNISFPSYDYGAPHPETFRPIVITRFRHRDHRQV